MWFRVFLNIVHWEFKQFTNMYIIYMHYFLQLKMSSFLFDHIREDISRAYIIVFYNSVIAKFYYFVNNNIVIDFCCHLNPFKNQDVGKICYICLNYLIFLLKQYTYICLIVITIIRLDDIESKSKLHRHHQNCLPQISKQHRRGI